MLQTSFAKPASSGSRERLGTRFDDRFSDMVALQRQTIALRKKQTNLNEDALHQREDDWLPNSAPQRGADDAQPELVPPPLAVQGPAAVA